MNEIQTLSDEEKQKIAQKLNVAGVKNICPMCGNNQFIMGSGYFKHGIQNSLSDTVIGGPSIPVIPIICNKCGFISQHAIGVLGLLESKKEVENESK